MTSLQARVHELEAEIARLREAEVLARQREQQLSTHNLVLVNLSRSTAIEEGDIAAAFGQITVAAAHTINVDRASIWVFTENRSAIKCLDLYERGPDRHGNGLELKAADFPSYFKAIEDNRTLAASDARTDPRTCEFDAIYLRPLGITSMLDAPVRRGGRLVGVICHEHIGEPREWSMEDQAFAGSMADFVSMTLQAAERADALRVARAGEHQLRQIIDLMPQMILAKDGRGQILLVNRAMAEAYGATVEQILGRSHWDVHPLRDEAAAMLSEDLQVIETGRERFTPEERFTDSRGNRRVLHTTRIPFMFSSSREPAVLAVSTDITQRKRDEQAREAMILELDHRVKNNLAVVIALAEHTCRTAPSVEAFNESFGGRLRSMAVSHEMLARTCWEGADLRAMAERIAKPYQSLSSAADSENRREGADGGEGDRIGLEGEALQLPATIAPNVCMILHELATNAAKHGALASARGRVVLSWYREMRADNDHRVPWLHIEWIERGGPTVHRPPTDETANKQGGFGTSFIRETARYQLRGQADLAFEPQGLHCTIDIPLERSESKPESLPITNGNDGSAHRQAGPGRGYATGVPSAGPGRPTAAADANSHRRRVLVVEDDLLVARSIGSHLESLGCEVIGPAATSADACALLKAKTVDAAILDINLSAGTSAPVARALAGRSTPFVFVTGYSSLKTLPDDLRGQRVLCKPIDRDSLGRALREMATQ